MPAYSGVFDGDYGDSHITKKSQLKKDYTGGTRIPSLIRPSTTSPKLNRKVIAMTPNMLVLVSISINYNRIL